jgi:hypothetical protein
MRTKLWKSLAEASDAVKTAFDIWSRDREAPAGVALMDRATHDYCERLAPIIGSEHAFAFEAAWLQYRDATKALSAAVSNDAQMEELRRLQSELQMAAVGFSEIEEVTSGLLEAAEARDRSKLH